MKRSFAALTLLPLLIRLAAGQSSSAVNLNTAAGAPALPSFEAVDVHASAPGVTPSGRFSLPEGRFEFYGTTIQMFIRLAWNVPEDRISDGPPWLDTDRFDVIAKTAKTVPVATQRQLLQTILADRFGLVVHMEDKPIPVFILSVGKRVQLKAFSSSDEEAGCKPNLAVESQRSIICRKTNMAGLAELLTQSAAPDISHPVVDKTGLTGDYDFTLTWTPRALSGVLGVASIFEVLDKELGLKIEEGKAPLPVLNVDRVNRKPTDNLPNVASVVAASPKEFEVSIVKPSKPGTVGQRLILLPGGRLEATNFPLRDLIAFAWNVEPPMVVNAEKWLESDRYDVVGTGANTGSIDTMRQMLQGVLADRFKLTIHREDRLMPVSPSSSLSVGQNLTNPPARMSPAARFPTQILREYSRARTRPWPSSPSDYIR
jgi:uncharacterized protein (TIGR03435 family)